MLDEIKRRIRDAAEHLEKRWEKRERTLLLARQAIRFCGEAISLFHQRKVEEGVNRLEKSLEILLELDEIFEEYPDLYYGDAHVAFQEFFEALFLGALIHKIPIDSPLFKEKYYHSMILGFSDLVGELRRAILESLIEGNVDRAVALSKIMEDIHIMLWTLEYPKSLVPGLRQKIDRNRRLIEDTRRVLAEATMLLKVWKLGETSIEKNQ